MNEQDEKAFEAQRAAARSGAMVGQISREKTWSERDTDAKLEALRGHVQHLLHVIADLHQRLDKLEIHQHGHNGQLLAPMGGPVSDHPRTFFTPMDLRDRE